MVVLCLSCCPPALQGELTLWMQEIDTGVYAGHLSARVRDELWERIIENVGNGRVTMVYSARNEQHMEFRVHNTERIPIDFDGLKLMFKPHRELARTADELPMPKHGYSSAAAMQRAKKYAKHCNTQTQKTESYTVADIETTGLSASEDQMIEIGALKVVNGKAADSFQALIRTNKALSETICTLTRLTNAELDEKGIDEREAIQRFMTFCGESTLIMHNMSFDLSFLRMGCKRCGLPMPQNRVIDTMVLAKRGIDDIDDYKLGTIADYFGIEHEGDHRSLSDCMTTHLVYEKLIEN